MTELEINCRVGHAVNWPVGLDSFVCDENPTAQAAFPQSPTTISHWWSTLLEYLLWGTVPPGTVVICGITIPAFASNVSLAREAADMIELEYTGEQTAPEICAAILASVEE